MRTTKALALAGALIISAVVGGTLIGSTLAQDQETDAATGEYCDVFMDALASELGTDRDGLVAAGRTAAIAAIDAAVAAGDLTEERAAIVRDRIEEADGTGCGWLGHGIGFARGFGHGVARGVVGADVFEAAADALGIESSELISQFRDAGSLEALAEELGASYDEVKASVIASIQADLDAAVAEGLDQERADAILDRITTWLDEGGEAREFGPRGHRPGRGGPWWSGQDGDDPNTEDSGA